MLVTAGDCYFMLTVKAGSTVQICYQEREEGLNSHGIMDY